MAKKKPTIHMGQLIYMELAEESKGNRKTLARIALNAAGHGQDYPVVLNDILCGLSWEEWHAALDLFSLRHNSFIIWSEADEARLRTWAK